MRINKHDTNGTKPLLGKGELGYDDYTAGGDTGRVYVGTGSVNIPQAKKAEVVAVDGKVDTHVVRVDNPHSVTKTQVGLGNVQNVDTTNASNITSGTLANARLANSGVTAGTYKSVTVDGKGIVTGGTNPTTLGEYGITDTYTKTETNTQISTAVNGLVDAAPGTLDTLNELAAALGDDPNFATTTANAIAAKVPKVTSTDNAIVRFDGTNGDVQNSSILIDDNGNLNITGTGKRITGDFSNATHNSRVAFQTSTLNSVTVVGVLPNGTATSSFLSVYNNSDNSNASFIQLSARATVVSIDSAAFGTGTILPLAFTTGGAERMRIDTSGNVLVTGSGALGYGTGSGGTVTQATSKETSVTLNKPTGTITMSNATLAPNVKVSFLFNNSLISSADTLLVSVISGSTVLTQYEARARCAIGIASIVLSHTYPTSLSDAVVIKFDIIKGATA